MDNCSLFLVSFDSSKEVDKNLVVLYINFGAYSSNFECASTSKI